MVVRIALICGLMTLACAASSSAQTVVDSFSRLPEVLKPGTTVIVTDEKGEQTNGKVSELSPASLRLLTGQVQRTTVFPADRVTRVSRLDSRLNGFLIGAAVGAVPGILLGMAFNQYCKNESPDYCPGAIVYGGALTGLAGGGIGYAIDGWIDGQTLVFARSVKF